MASKRALNVAKALGANQALGTVHLMVFVPSADKDGRKLKGPSWTRPTLTVLGRLFRGATAYPKGLGVWRNDQAGGNLVFDDTTIVFTYIAPADLSDRRLRELRTFLHRMGRETRQGEIGLVLDGHYIGITEFEGQ